MVTRIKSQFYRIFSYKIILVALLFYQNCSTIDQEHFLNNQKDLAMINVRILLEDFYEISQSRMIKKSNQLLSLEQPFKQAPYYYFGKEKIPPQFQPFHPDVIDWVLVELKASLSKDEISFQRAGFITRDGSLVAQDGKSLITFDITPGYYHLIIHHPNHYPLIAPDKIHVGPQPFLHDLTTYHTAQSQKQKEYIYLTKLSENNYGMIAKKPENEILKVDPIFISNVSYFNGKVFLQGAFSKERLAMNSELSLKNYISINQPYEKLTQYFGTEKLQEPVAQKYPNLVDWLLIQLLDKPQGKILTQRAALLNRNGSIADIDGVSPVKFNIKEGAYYVKIIHRNHQSIISKKPIILTGKNPPIQDLTSNGHSMKNLKKIGQHWMMIAGDLNHDGKIQTNFKGKEFDSDFQKLIYQMGQTGYQRCDLNFDGVCDASDIDLYRENSGYIYLKQAKK